MTEPNTTQKSCTRWQLAGLIAKQVARQYRLFSGPKWEDAGDYEKPLDVTVHISELEGVPVVMESNWTTLESYVQRAHWFVSQKRYLDGLVLVRIYRAQDGSWPNLAYTGDVVVRAVDHPR